MDTQKLIKLLSDGEFHSGSELGKALGVSRTSIWKSLSQFEEMSIPIEVIKGKGYRIPGGLDLLDNIKINSSLSADISTLLNTDILLSHSSTNDYLSSISKSCINNKYHACLAEIQHNGRGRRGKVWASPFAKNIYLSISFGLEGGADRLNGLSLVVGIAVANTLKNLGVRNVGLKWPNDVFVGGKKIAGILLELNGEATTSWNVICGIGLNVSMTKEEGRDIDQEWVSLSDFIECDRNIIAAKLMSEFVVLLEEFRSSSFSQFMDRWNYFDVLLGQDISVMPGGLVGRVEGVNSQGALLVRNSELHTINAGEVSVRKL